MYVGTNIIKHACMHTMYMYAAECDVGGWVVEGTIPLVVTGLVHVYDGTRLVNIHLHFPPLHASLHYMSSADRVPKLDLLKTCVAAIPRVIPSDISNESLVDLLSHLTIHIDHELCR